MKGFGRTIACFAVICSMACAPLTTQKKYPTLTSEAKPPVHTLAVSSTSPLTASTTSSLATAKATSVALTALKITQGPYLQAPSETGMTVVWATNRKCVSKVEYGTLPSAQMTAFNSQHGLMDANTTLHKVHISGLTPGTKYYYRLVSTEIRDFQAYKVIYGETVKSEFYPFTTLNSSKDGFSFVVLNDRHEKVPQLKSALDSIKWDSIDLAFLNGDMLSDLKNEQQVFRNAIAPCVSAFAKTIPFIFVRGNHEARGYFARMLMDYFPTDSQRYYFSLDHGQVHFIVLDSGEDKEDSSPEYSGLVDFDRYREQETEWLKKDIESEASKKAKYRIVFVHIPPNGGANRHGAAYVAEQWVPLLNEARIDLMISAHTHRYAVMKPQQGKNAFPIVVGDVDTVIRVDISDQRLNMTVTKNDGTVMDNSVYSAR
jgi:predicted phosphodiesterase